MISQPADQSEQFSRPADQSEQISCSR